VRACRPMSRWRHKATGTPPSILMPLITGSCRRGGVHSGDQRAVLFKRGVTQRGPMRYVLGAIDRVRDGYVWIVRRLVRVAVFAVVAVAVIAIASVGLMRITPQGFLPSEDQGAFFVAMRLPEGASVNRTEDLVAKVENIIRPVPDVQAVLSVVGLNFIDYVAASNQAFFIVKLKPYAERTAAAEVAETIISRLPPP